MLYELLLSFLSDYPNWPRLWGSGSLEESTWCDCAMVEADSHLKLLSTSILDIYKVFECIDLLSMGIQYQLYTVLPTLLGSDFGFWVTFRVKMMSLCHGWGWWPPQTASGIHIKHIQSVWAHWHAVRHMVAALHSFTHTTCLRFWVLGHLRSQNDVIMSWLRPKTTSNCFPHPY